MEESKAVVAKVDDKAAALTKEVAARVAAVKLTPEEREARYKELRERMAVSRIYVRPPAGIACGRGACRARA